MTYFKAIRQQSPDLESKAEDSPKADLLAVEGDLGETSTDGQPEPQEAAESDLSEKA